MLFFHNYDKSQIKFKLNIVVSYFISEDCLTWHIDFFACCQLLFFCSFIFSMIIFQMQAKTQLWIFLRQWQDKSDLFILFIFVYTVIYTLRGSIWVILIFTNYVQAGAEISEFQKAWWWLSTCLKWPFVVTSGHFGWHDQSY